MNREESKYLIAENLSIRKALGVLNEAAHDTQSLLVVDAAGRMVGSLTDGDIRRGLIAGAQLTDPVAKVMQRRFHALPAGAIDVARLRELRERQITFVPILDSEGWIVEVVNLRKFRSRLPIDAVLMAGGKGERLRPLTERTPKPLLPVGGKAIIDHNVDRLIDYGVRHITVTVNYLKEQLIDHYATPRRGVQVGCCAEPRFLGTIGSLRLIETFHNDTVLVMNSDLFTRIDYEDFYLHFREYEADMSVAAIPYNLSIPYGILELEERYIRGLHEKPQYNRYANAGIYLLRRELLEEIPAGTFFHTTDLIRKLIAEGRNVIRYPLNGTWIDIGTPQEYQRANDLVHHLK